MVSSCGFVRIPGQQVTKLPAPVYDLETLHELELGHGIDDVLIAVPPSWLNALPQILAVTKNSAPQSGPWSISGKESLSVSVSFDSGDCMFSISPTDRWTT